jgi:thioesterase domain-containing protein
VLAEPGPLAGLSADRISALAEVFAAHRTVLDRGTTGRFDGDALVVRATEDKTDQSPTPTDWQAHVGGRVRVHDIACRHGEIAAPGPLAEIGALVATLLEGTPA